MNTRLFQNFANFGNVKKHTRISIFGTFQSLEPIFSDFLDLKKTVAGANFDFMSVSWSFEFRLSLKKS